MGSASQEYWTFEQLDKAVPSEAKSQYVDAFVAFYSLAEKDKVSTVFKAFLIVFKEIFKNALQQFVDKDFVEQITNPKLSVEDQANWLALILFIVVSSGALGLLVASVASSLPALATSLMALEEKPPEVSSPPTGGFLWLSVLCIAFVGFVAALVLYMHKKRKRILYQSLN